MRVSGQIQAMLIQLNHLRKSYIFYNRALQKKKVQSEAPLALIQMVLDGIFCLYFHFSLGCLFTTLTEQKIVQVFHPFEELFPL